MLSLNQDQHVRNPDPLSGSFPTLLSLSLLASVSLAAITVDASCSGTKATNVNDILTEAIAMAQNVVDNGSQTHPALLGFSRLCSDLTCSTMEALESQSTHSLRNGVWTVLSF